MLKRRNEDDVRPNPDALRCAIRWPASKFKRFRFHVELAETGEATLEMHLKDCLPGTDQAHARAAELRASLAILRIYGKHPDVEEGRRKASEIWLEAHKNAARRRQSLIK